MPDSTTAFDADTLRFGHAEEQSAQDTIFRCFIKLSTHEDQEWLVCAEL
jgi:hypothetical protein